MIGVNDAQDLRYRAFIMVAVHDDTERLRGPAVDDAPRRPAISATRVGVHGQTVDPPHDTRTMIYEARNLRDYRLMMPGIRGAPEDVALEEGSRAREGNGEQ